MTVESTIASLLEESRKFKSVEEANEVMPGKETPEPSNAKNNVDDEVEAKGGTSKKPNRATQGAVAPESMPTLQKEEEEVDEDEVVAEEATIEKTTIDMSEDIAALFNGEEGLTESFRAKAETIFEAAVTSRIKEEIARVEESLTTQYEAKLEEALEEQIEGLVEHVDGYLNLMVEQWMENNAVALEAGMKASVLESFVGGLKNLFQEHYIEVPEEKFDLIGSLESKVESLTAKLDESFALNVDMLKTIDNMKRDDIISEACNGLSDLESEKLQTLAEEIAFENADSFSQKMQTIRENYFMKKTTKSEAPSATFLSEETIQEEKRIPAEMAAYVNTIASLKR